jgi:sulfur carrier protein
LKIELNGDPMETDATDLDALCRVLGFNQEDRIATAVNGAFVAEAARAGQQLQDGDSVEIVSPRQGG